MGLMRAEPQTVAAQSRRGRLRWINPGAAGTGGSAPVRKEAQDQSLRGRSRRANPAASAAIPAQTSQRTV